MQLFDAPFHHLLHHHGGLQQIRAVLGIKRAVASSTDDVPGAPDALQTRGHSRWGFDLDHELHRAHINAQFQRAGRHHCAQRAFFEHGFGHRTLVFRHRPVVRPGNNRWGFAGHIGLFHQLRRVASLFW